jgi:hypothetical protein
MPKRSTTRLSDRLIKTLPSPTTGSRIVYDADLPGFGVRLTAKGARSFVFNYALHRNRPLEAACPWGLRSAMRRL